MASMTDRPGVRGWVERYERAWRTPGTEELSALFTTDATYLHSPYEEPVVGIDAIGRMWDKDRDGPNEVFTLSTEIVAVEGDTAVVRAEVLTNNPLARSIGTCGSFNSKLTVDVHGSKSGPIGLDVPTLPDGSRKLAGASGT
jgi:ketosteroid isomerase-like protein